MTTWLHMLAAYLLVLQGSAYIVAAAVVFHGRLTLDALRFAGTGLGWIFLALLNLSAIASRTRRGLALAVGANSLGGVYFVLLAVAAPGWRTAIAILLVLGCLVGSVMALRQLSALQGPPRNGR
ncbi:MAG: hypothetical protein GTO22_19430 [Gemmatimonadales bacterium]|nr:hypothetical protein [Gemmatimonadales bacterium]